MTHPLTCVVCGGPPPGARIVHTLFVCRACRDSFVKQFVATQAGAANHQPQEK